MGFFFNFGFGGNQREPLNIETDTAGNIFYTMFSSSTALGKVIPDADKLRIVLQNPALLKVIALDCDIFSLGKINQYQDEKLKEVNFLYSESKKPNLFQSWTQFTYDYKFWLNIFGTSYLYNPNNSKILNESSNIQWLNPCNFQWDSSLVQKLQALVLSKQSYNDIFKNSVLYRFDNGDSKWIKLTEITPFYDLTNAGSNNPMKGYSRIDALFKVIKNSELALDSKSINLEFTQKFLVDGQANPEDPTKAGIPMTAVEKENIENKIRSNKSVHAVKSKININRFVEDMNKLKLDESFYNDYFMFGTMFNIPRDILEANLRGSTYENQEKSMARLIEYCETPKGQMLTDWFENQYGYQDLRMSWAHLMFNQIFEKERAEQTGIKLDNIIKAKDAMLITDSEAKRLSANLLN